MLTCIPDVGGGVIEGILVYDPTQMVQYVLDNVPCMRELYLQKMQ